jgi:hypothetical protein
MLLLPPSTMLCTWSASVATLTPHQWHGGLSASSRARFFLNSVLLRVWLFRFVAMAHAPSAGASAALARLAIGVAWLLFMSG